MHSATEPARHLPFDRTAAPEDAGYGGAVWGWHQEFARLFALQMEMTEQLGVIASRATEEMMEIWGVSPIGSAAFRAGQPHGEGLERGR